MNIPSAEFHGLICYVDPIYFLNKRLYNGIESYAYFEPHIEPAPPYKSPGFHYITNGLVGDLFEWVANKKDETGYCIIEILFIINLYDGLYLFGKFDHKIYDNDTADISLLSGKITICHNREFINEEEIFFDTYDDLNSLIKNQIRKYDQSNKNS